MAQNGLTIVKGSVIRLLFGAERAAKFLAIGALLGALGVLLLGATSDSAKLQFADSFMLLVKQERFEEAAKAFFYPVTYKPQRLAREQAAVGGFLASLFKVAGNLSDQERGSPKGVSASWLLGISGADGPVNPSDIGADSSDIVYYQGRFANEGSAVIALILAHVHGDWRILRFDFRIPRSAEHGPDDFAEFSRKVFSGCGACKPPTVSRDGSSAL
jgi:hypothetical protein